jgi:hypothetical protein
VFKALSVIAVCSSAVKAWVPAAFQAVLPSAESGLTAKDLASMKAFKPPATSPSWVKL